MLKKLLISTVLIAGILSPVAAHAAQDPYDPMTVHATTSDFKPISPFAQDPYEPFTIFPPTE